MKILHISSGCETLVVKETARDYVCKILINPKEITYLKVGTTVKIAKSAIGITYRIISE